MSSFKAVLCWAAALFACVSLALVADFATTVALTRSATDDAGRLNRILNECPPAGEIPIFGASEAGADYVPAQLGPNYFNYGFFDSSPAVTNVLLSFELNCKSTQPVIIALHPEEFGDVGDIRGFLPFSHKSAVQKLLKDAGKWHWYYAVSGIRYFGSYDWYLKDLLTDHFQLTRRVAQGYSYEYNSPKWDRQLFERQVAERSESTLTWGMNEKQQETLLSLVKGMPNRHFFIIISPMHKSNYVHTLGLEKFERQMAAFQQMPNLTFLDFSQLQYPDQSYRDTRHLNIDGATHFSSSLRAIIEGNAARSWPAGLR